MIQQVYQILKQSLTPSFFENQQFLEHFNQYIYHEWRSYYFAYGLLKKEYHRLQGVPNACKLYEAQVLREMKRVYDFLQRMLNQVEDDLNIVSSTIEALQATVLSKENEDELQDLVSTMNQDHPSDQEDESSRSEVTSMSRLPNPKKHPIAFLKKSIKLLHKITEKVETIIIDEDRVKKHKKKQLNHSIELAIRSIYAMLSRCEQYYKFNSYAINKAGKRMEKLYIRRPIHEIPSQEIIQKQSELKRRLSRTTIRLDKEIISDDIALLQNMSQKYTSLRRSNKQSKDKKTIKPEKKSEASYKYKKNEEEIEETLENTENNRENEEQDDVDDEDDDDDDEMITTHKHNHQYIYVLKKEWKDTPSGMFFHQEIASLGERITSMKQQCIELYSQHYKKANMKLAAFELEFVENRDRNYRDTKSFITFKLGIILTIMFWLATDSFFSKNGNSEFWGQPSIYVYTTIFNILLYRLFWAIDIAIWTRYGINYISVLELRTIKSNLLFVINQTATFLTLFFISLLIFYRATNNSQNTYRISLMINGSPLLLLMFSICIQVFQTCYYYQSDSSRGIFNKHVLWNIFRAPFVPLTFRDNYAADILTSFTKIISDGLYASCWVVSGSFLGHDSQESTSFGSEYLQCKSDNMILAVSILQLIPLIIRFNQCIRAYFDSNYKIFPFLFNALKYLLSMIVVILAIKGYGNTIVYIIFVVISTLYKWWWDIAMDWGLLEILPRNWLEIIKIQSYSSKKFFLRTSMLYPNIWIYYSCMILNLFLRFLWVLSLTPMSWLGGLVDAKLALFIGSMEIIRRSIWGILRIEWEHVKHLRNDVPGYLPTQVLRKHEWAEIYQNKQSSKESNYIMPEPLLTNDNPTDPWGDDQDMTIHTGLPHEYDNNSNLRSISKEYEQDNEIGLTINEFFDL